MHFLWDKDHESIPYCSLWFHHFRWFYFEINRPGERRLKVDGAPKLLGAPRGSQGSPKESQGGPKESQGAPKKTKWTKYWFKKLLYNGIFKASKLCLNILKGTPFSLIRAPENSQKRLKKFLLSCELQKVTEMGRDERRNLKEVTRSTNSRKLSLNVLSSHPETPRGYHKASCG